MEAPGLFQASTLCHDLFEVTRSAQRGQAYEARTSIDRGLVTPVQWVNKEMPCLLEPDSVPGWISMTHRR